MKTINILKKETTKFLISAIIWKLNNNCKIISKKENLILFNSLGELTYSEYVQLKDKLSVMGIYFIYNINKNYYKISYLN